jgi:hypothetical protein
LSKVIGEDEADADDEIHPFGGEQPETRLPVRPFAGLDEADPDAELLLGALGAKVGTVIERLVAASAEVEDDADVHGVASRGLFGAGGVGEQEGDVDDEQDAHEEKQLPHDVRKLVPGRGAGKAAQRQYPIPIGVELALLTTTDPFMPGWRWQSNSNVPAVLNVRAAIMFALAPGIESGAPAGELSKKTLWATSPKEKVTVPPTAIVTFAGVKVFAEVALTVAAMGSAPPGLLDDPA